MGKIRIRQKGGHGGHNGLQSIIEAAETQEIPRVRIGIGGEEEEDWIDFVLSPFSSREREIMDETIQRVGEAIEMILFEGFEKSMNFYNR